MTEKAKKVHYQKALWIANEIGEDPDDVYDVLLGNITQPSRFVAQVKDESRIYDERKERGVSQPF